MLGETAVGMMLQVIRPLGELLTRLPVGPQAPGVTAGPGFMLTKQVAAGRMPCDGAWPAERVALFRRWVQAGSPD
jgi:hypothetical protein